MYWGIGGIGIKVGPRKMTTTKPGMQAITEWARLVLARSGSAGPRKVSMAYLWGTMEMEMELRHW